MIKYLHINFLPIHTTLSICFIGSVMLLFACTSLTPKPSSMDCTPVDTSAIQGKIVGTWQGLAMNTAEVSGEFDITIMPNGRITGSYTGSASGSISGCVDNNWNIDAEGTGSGGVFAWKGKMSNIDNKIVATGTWFFDASKGTWSGHR